MRNDKEQFGSHSIETGSVKRNQQLRGMNKGKGPRSYQRSDQRILDDINDRLCDNPYIDPSDMEVAVKDCEVILSGTVQSRDEKKLAVEIAESVSGVTNIENRLHVTLQGI